MTDQPYTPTTEDIRLAHAESVTFHVMEEPELTEANNMFDRWYVAEIAAAEQRGAERAFDEAVEKIASMEGNRMILARYKHLNPYRADRIANKEDE